MSLQPLVTIPLVTGPVFILASLVMMRFPPKNINAWYGYRTYASMKNSERWNFAQRYAAKEMLRMGLAYTSTACLGFLWKPNQIIEVVVAMVLLFAGIGIMMYRVEKGLANRFDRN